MCESVYLSASIFDGVRKSCCLGSEAVLRSSLVQPRDEDDENEERYRGGSYVSKLLRLRYNRYRQVGVLLSRPSR